MIKDIIKHSEEKMKKTVSVLVSDLQTLKAGRANPTMLDKIQVEYYGSMCPLNQVANVSAPEPRVLMITPWEKPLLKDIEKAILKSDLGLNPSNDGSVKKYGEESKVAVRSIRRDANEKIKALKKEADISEDEIKKGEEDVQKVTDIYIKDIDAKILAKEKEIMSV